MLMIIFWLIKDTERGNRIGIWKIEISFSRLDVVIFIRDRNLRLADAIQKSEILCITAINLIS